MRPKTHVHVCVRVLFCRIAASGADERRIRGNELFSLSVWIRVFLCRMRERA